MEEERDTVSPLQSFESDNSQATTEDLGKPKYERKVTLEQQYMYELITSFHKFRIYEFLSQFLN